MISNIQMEKLWAKYQREGIEKNLSMQAFCSIHNVPYNAFEKYLKLRRHLSEVHSVKVTDIPDDEIGDDKSSSADSPESMSGTEPKLSGSTRIMISIRMTNGIQISKKNMNYQALRNLVEKLEVLC